MTMCNTKWIQFSDYFQTKCKLSQTRTENKTFINYSKSTLRLAVRLAKLLKLVEIIAYNENKNNVKMQ